MSNELCPMCKRGILKEKTDNRCVTRTFRKCDFCGEKYPLPKLAAFSEEKLAKILEILAEKRQPKEVV